MPSTDIWRRKVVRDRVPGHLLEFRSSTREMTQGVAQPSLTTSGKRKTEVEVLSAFTVTRTLGHQAAMTDRSVSSAHGAYRPPSCPRKPSKRYWIITCYRILVNEPWLLIISCPKFSFPSLICTSIHKYMYMYL